MRKLHRSHDGAGHHLGTTVNAPAEHPARWRELAPASCVGVGARKMFP